MKPLDRVDRLIVEALWEDARQSHQAIADRVGVTEGTVRGRLKRLVDEGAVHVTARNTTGLDSQVLAYLWISCDRTRLREIALALSADPAVAYVASLLGRADLIAIVANEDHAALVDYVDQKVKPLDGVSDVRVEPILKTLVSDMRWGILRGAGG
jgi:Lrp/AsnC family transcriptional regulator for asnA, asnC and gidA